MDWLAVQLDSVLRAVDFGYRTFDTSVRAVGAHCRRRCGGLAETGAKPSVRDGSSQSGEPEGDRVIDEHGRGCVREW